MSQENQRILLQTADMYVNLVKKLLAPDLRSDPETLISSTSRMAGTLMFRSFCPDTSAYEAGQMLVLPQTDERAAHLTILLNTTLEQLGNTLNLEQASKHLDPNAISKLSLAQVQTRFEPVFVGIAKEMGLSLPQAACATCMASAVLVHEARNKIPLERAYITAVYGQIEALKIVPVTLASDQKIDVTSLLQAQPTKPTNQTARKKPWYRFW